MLIRWMAEDDKRWWKFDFEFFRYVLDDPNLHEDDNAFTRAAFLAEPYEKTLAACRALGLKLADGK